MAAAASTSTPARTEGAQPATGGGGQLAMLPAELGELGPEDERLSAADLKILSLFRSEEFEKEKNVPNFLRFSGTSVLRRFRKGQVICTQGDAGATAFYILTTEDVLALRRRQKEEFEAALRELAAGSAGARLPEFDEGDPQAHLDALSREAAELEERLRRLPAPGPERDRELSAATVLLTPNLQAARKKRRGGFAEFLGRLFGGGSRTGASAAAPRSIAIDAPVGLQSQNQFKGTLHEGQLFGEMSCLNRSPRSATVIADRDCYMLEILRNVLDMLHSDEKYKARIDADYRKRVLETDVRRLEYFGEVFDRLSEAEFQAIQDRIELVEFPAGSVVMEEGADSDAVYIVRNGLAKVIKNGQYSLRMEEFSKKEAGPADARWTNLIAELAALEVQTEDPLAVAVRNAISPTLKSLVQAQPGVDPAVRGQILGELNGLIHQGQSVAQKIKVGSREVKRLDELLELIEDPQVAESLVSFPPTIKNWSEYEGRVFARGLLEIVCPRGVPKRLDIYGPPVVLNYLGRGEVLGEMGLLTGAARGATVIAYDHPDGYNQRVPDSRTGAVPSRIELIKLGAALFHELRTRFPDLDVRLKQVVVERTKMNESLAAPAAGVGGARGILGGEFEQLGLVQGQQLMLIDLDRCTRCGACVEACVNAHDDGFSRLYLDGMRFDKYLVPLSCRSCLDPVCMIGCPVGSIQRGANRQIEIKNWCIGCAVCADQCPYGSIQMNPIEKIELSTAQLAVLPSSVELKPVETRAVVCDLCSSHAGRTPMCVYSCPHDAAHRVIGRDLLLDGSLFAPLAKSGS